MTMLDIAMPVMLDAGSEDSSGKRRQILDGARKIFMAHGFDGASMNDIVRAAGVSKGTLYAYFSSKEGLFETLIREDRRQQAERITDFSHQPGDLRQVLQNFGEQLLELMTRPETLAHLRIVIAASGKFPQLGRAFFEAGPQYGAERLAKYLRDQRSAGRLAMADPYRAAWHFLDLCQSETHRRLLFRLDDAVTPNQIKNTVSAGVDVFMAAYGAPVA